MSHACHAEKLTGEGNSKNSRGSKKEWRPARRADIIACTVCFGGPVKAVIHPPLPSASGLRYTARCPRGEGEG